MTHGLGPSYRAGNPVVKKVVKMLMTLNLFDPDDVEESFEVRDRSCRTCLQGGRDEFGKSDDEKD